MSRPKSVSAPAVRVNEVTPLILALDEITGNSLEDRLARKAIAEALDEFHHRTPPTAGDKGYSVGQASLHHPMHNKRVVDKAAREEELERVLAVPERRAPKPRNARELTDQALHVLNAPARALAQAQEQAAPKIKAADKYVNKHGTGVPSGPNYVRVEKFNYDTRLDVPPAYPPVDQVKLPEPEGYLERLVERLKNRRPEIPRVNIQAPLAGVDEALAVPVHVPAGQREQLLRRASKMRHEHNTAAQIVACEDDLEECQERGDARGVLRATNNLNVLLEQFRREIRRMG